MKTTTLFVFHGANTKETQSSVNIFKKQIEPFANPSLQVEVCFLKSQSPSFKAALNSAINGNSKEIRVIPMLLLPGTHATKDIPQIVNDAQLKNPDLEIKLDDCLLQDPNFIKYLITKL